MSYGWCEQPRLHRKHADTGQRGRSRQTSSLPDLQGHDKCASWQGSKPAQKLLSACSHAVELECTVYITWAVRASQARDAALFDVSTSCCSGLHLHAIKAL